MRAGSGKAKLLRSLLVAVAVAAALVLGGIIPISIDPFRGMIEQSVRDATGLELTLGEAASIRLGPRARVRTGRVSIATPGHESLLEFTEAQVGLSLSALFRGRVHVREATVTGTRLVCGPLPGLPPDGDDDVESPPVIVVDSFEAREIVIRCTPEAVDVSVDRVFATAPADGPVTLQASGRVAGEPVTLDATGGRLEQLLGGDEFPFEGALEHAEAKLDVRGSVTQSGGAAELDLHFGFRSNDFRRLGRSFGFAVADTGGLGVEGQLRTDFDSAEITGVSGALGRSRFRASGTAQATDDRVRVAISLLLQQLDLAPFLASDVQQPAATSGSDDDDIDLGEFLELMKSVDAELQLEVDDVLGLPFEVRSGEVDARLAGGLLEVSSATAEILGGRVALGGRLDGREACPSLEWKVDVRNVDLAGLRQSNLLEIPVGGQVAAASASAGSCGRTLSQHLDRLVATTTANGIRLTSDGAPSIDIGRFEAGLEPGEPTRASAQATIEGEAVHVTLVAGSLQALLADEAWPLELAARGAGGRLRLDGQARFPEGGVAADVTAEFSADAVGSLHRWIDVAADARLPLNARSRLVVDGPGLVARDVAVTLGDSDLRGRITWDHEQAPDVLKLELRSRNIDLQQVASVVPPIEVADTGPEQQHQPGSGQFRLPDIDLDLGFDAIDGGRLDLQALSISGQLREALIDNASVSVIVEDELALRGELDLDLRRSPATGAFEGTADNADLGRLLRRLELADDLSMRADGMGLRITSSGANPLAFAANARIDADVTGFAWDIAVPGTDGKDAYKVRLARLGLSAAPRRPITATSSGQIEDVLVDLYIQAPPLAEWLGDTQELPLRIITAADNDVVMIDARIDQADDARVQMQLELSGQRLERGERKLETLESPLADYELRGNLTVDESGVRLPDLEARLGTSTASGSISLSGDGRQRLDIELTAPYIQADDLLYLDSRASGQDGVPEIEVGPADEIERSGTTRGPLRIAHDLIVRYQENYDLDLRIGVDELRAGEDLLGGAEVHLYLDEDELRLKPLSVYLPGGGIDAEYEWRLRDGRIAAGLRARADRLVYGGLLQLADPTSEARGLLDLDVDISSDTEWSPGVSEFELLLRNASGTIDLAAWPENIEAGVLDLWTANLVLALLPVSTEGEQSQLNCVVARLEAKAGLLETKTVMLDSTDTIIRGRGEVDLARGELDLLITPQAKREKFLSASTPARVTGPLNDFQIGVAPAGMLGTVIKWYTNLIYVPFKWLTGKRFPPDGTETCFDAMDWELTPELHEYFRQRDFSLPPRID